MDCATGGDPAFQQPFDAAAADAAAVEGVQVSDDGEAWRREVAVRLERYRARRKPRAPRYPSLFLPFDNPEIRRRPAVQESEPAPITDASSRAGIVRLSSGQAPGAPISVTNIALQIEEAALEGASNRGPVQSEVEETLGAPTLAILDIPEPTARVIEFPRSAAIPVFHAPELAEPIIDRPRIVEAPEVIPPPPALGGILIEPAATKESEKRNAAEIPGATATIGQRLAAALVDGLILGTALAAFAAIFLRFNPERVPVPLLVASFAAIAVLFWSVYQFLFIVYTGSTPGLRALRLRLVRFDGSPVQRSTRRWRVLASFLSAFSLGLGYLWSILDEDGLCWHDRITRTHMQAASPEKLKKA